MAGSSISSQTPAVKGTEKQAAPRRNSAITTASGIYLVQGLGTLVSFVPIIIFVVRNRAFPVAFGIPLMGGYFSDRLGVDFMVRAALLFEVVNALEVLAGYWLWKSQRRGGKLALILLPLGLPFWLLFELPVPLLAGPLKAIAVAAGWKTLR